MKKRRQKKSRMEEKSTFSPLFAEKQPVLRGNIICVMREKNGNYARKYTPGYRGPADDKKGQIPVENTYFSTISTMFSTACFRWEFCATIYNWVDIMRFDRFQLFWCFFPCGNYANGEITAKKIGLDRGKNVFASWGRGLSAGCGREKDGQCREKT